MLLWHVPPLQQKPSKQLKCSNTPKGQPMRVYQAVGLAEPTPSNRHLVTELLEASTQSSQHDWQQTMTDRTRGPAHLAGIAKTVMRIKRFKTFDQHGWTAETARALLSDPVMKQF
eukprot:2647661-Amphidinium_carterae.1